MKPERIEELREYCNPTQSPRWINIQEITECLDEIEKLQRENYQLIQDKLRNLANLEMLRKRLELCEAAVGIKKDDTAKV